MKITKITEDFLELSPAYGRDYKNKDAAIQDFVNGKDWDYYSVRDGKSWYCSIRDFEKGVKVILRYANSQKSCVYTVV